MTQLTLLPHNTKTRHSLKDPKSGKYVSKKPPWSAPGSKGFWNFIKEVKKQIENKPFRKASLPKLLSKRPQFVAWS